MATGYLQDSSAHGLFHLNSQCHESFTLFGRSQNWWVCQVLIMITTIESVCVVEFLATLPREGTQEIPFVFD